MGTPEIDPEFRSEVARLVEAELRYHKRLNWTLAAWFITGVVVAAGTWFIQKPMDRDSIMFSGVCGVGLATFFFGSMFTRLLLRRPDTRCPRCGYDWRLSQDGILTWEHCPGCGLKMSDDTGCHEQP